MNRFELYERKMDDLEGEIESYDMGQKTLADEIEELAADEDLDAELEALKARLSNEQGSDDEANAPKIANH